VVAPPTVANGRHTRPVTSPPTYPGGTSAATPGGLAPAWPPGSPGYSRPIGWEGLPWPRSVAYSRDWRGAVVAVTAGVFVTVAIVFLALLLDSNAGGRGIGGLPTGSVTVGIVAIFVAVAFGGSVDVDSVSRSLSSGSFQVLGPALIGIAVIGWIWARRLSRDGAATLGSAAAQAGRCVVVLVLELLAVVAASYAGPSAGGLSVHADAVTTVLTGSVALIAGLVVAGFLGLHGIADSRTEQVRALVAGPLRAVMVLLAAGMAVTFVTVLVAVGSNAPVDGGPRWPSILAYLAMTLPDITVMALLFGLDVPFTNGFADLVPGLNVKRSTTVLDLVGHGGLTWLWPVAAVVLVLLAGYLAGRWSPFSARGRSLAPVLAVVFPAVMVMLLLSSGGAAGVGVSLPARLGIGLSVPLAIVITAGSGLVAGLLGSVLAGRGPVRHDVQRYRPPEAREPVEPDSPLRTPLLRAGRHRAGRA